MGTRVGDDVWHVDHIVGPGPRANHARYRFSPDLDYQTCEIAQQFHDTGGRSTYLGDWHSHPGATHGRLSYKDQGVLKKITNAPAAQCQVPLMMILWGQPDQWIPSLWHARYLPSRFLPKRLKIGEGRLIMVEGPSVLEL